MSPYPSWQPGYRVSCCSIWSDFGSGSYCLSHPPFQISVDPNVWVLESTTCFLMRCQGNTLQEQRTRGRGATAEVQMRATSPALIFFPLSVLQKQMQWEKTWLRICKNGKRHVFTNMSKKRKATRQNILAGGKKLKKGEKRQTPA